MRRILFTLAMLMAFTAFGQGDADPFREFTFKFSNDFTHMTDRYYSNGFYGELTLPGLRKNPMNIIFIPFDKGITYNSVTLTQDFFTPDFKINEFESRPFASYLLIGMRQQTLLPEKAISLTSELQLGLIGTNSGGEAIQNGTHKVFPGADTVSWANQIQNDVGINYRILLEKQALSLNHLQIVLHAEGQLGTPITQISGGARVKVGWFEDYFMPRGSYEGNWQLYLFNDVKGAYVMHNSTLQGGLFAENPYTRCDMTSILVRVETGIGFAYKNAFVELGQNFLSPEFKLGENHRWGYLSFKYRF